MVELADGSVLVRRDVDPFQSSDQEATWSLVAPDTATPVKPDAVFPNNWVSFHADGTVVH